MSKPAKTIPTKKKLTVGLVFDDSLDRPDGVQQYVQRLAEYLADEGHEVHFLVGETLRTDLPNVHSLTRNLRVKFNGNSLSMPKPTPKHVLGTMLHDYDFDVLHVQVPYSPFMAGRLMKMANAKTAIIGTFHILPYTKLVVFGSRLLAMINRKTGKQFDAMMAVSPPAKRFADSLYGYACNVVPNPIRVSDFSSDEAQKQNGVPRIVFLGRLVERKGARQLLEAVAYMRDMQYYGDSFEVIVGGKGDLLDELRGFARHAGLKDTVKFVGFIPEADKVALLASADLAVFPSISGESFGISLLEAMAAARGVVLAGNNPGYASVMHGLSDRLFDPLDTPSFAKTIAKWLSDPAARLSAATEQQHYVRQFDISIVGSSIESMYFDVISKKALHQ